MIWVAGRIVPDEDLKISAFDRTFEHGLGLFETLRTWKRRPVLLPRHLERMTTSAKTLGIPLDRATLPSADDVERLLKADGRDGDAMLRITLSGGTSDEGGSVVWMRSAPLPPPMRKEGAIVALGPWVVAQHDPVAQHKTLNYWLKRMAYEEARKQEFDEVLSLTPGPCFWEGSRTNLFVIQGDYLMTPSLDGPIVAGIMRRLVLELARELPLEVNEVPGIQRHNLRSANEVFLTNAVRGIIPVARAGTGRKWMLQPGQWTEWPAPGPWTQRLAIRVSDWLDEQGTTR